MSLVAECPECGDRKLVMASSQHTAPVIWCSHGSIPEDERVEMDAFVPMTYHEPEPIEGVE